MHNEYITISSHLKIYKRKKDASLVKIPVLASKISGKSVFKIFVTKSFDNFYFTICFSNCN